MVPNSTYQGVKLLIDNSERIHLHSTMMMRKNIILLMQFGFPLPDEI